METAMDLCGLFGNSENLCAIVRTAGVVIWLNTPTTWNLTSKPILPLCFCDHRSFTYPSLYFRIFSKKKISNSQINDRLNHYYKSRICYFFFFFVYLFFLHLLKIYAKIPKIIKSSILHRCRDTQEKFEPYTRRSRSLSNHLRLLHPFPH